MNLQEWRDLGDAAYEGIDPGIVFAVKVLHARGITTCQSCQGGEGHAYPAPTVDLQGSHAEGWQALAALLDCGLPVQSIARLWDVIDGEVTGPIWRIEFRDSFEDRKNDQPSFVWSAAWRDEHHNADVGRSESRP